MSFNEHVQGDKLRLDYQKIDIEELISFLQENRNITQLSLKSCVIGNKEAKALANLTNLTVLDLSCVIGNKEAKALAKLTNLTVLDLAYNKIGNEGAKALANLTNLTELNLAYNKIGNEGAKALANLTNLTVLDLAYNNIGEEGAKALAKLTNLTVLDLIYNNIGEEGAKALAESEECWGFIDKLVYISESDSIGFCKRLKASWSQARTKSNGNVGKLDENSVKKLFFDLARQNYRKEGIKLLLDDSDKYPFLINSRNEQGHTLSHFYTHVMQKLFFERGMVPEEERNQRRDDERIAQDSQYDRYLEEEQKLEAQKDVITKENIQAFLEGLANKLIQHVELHPELKKALGDFALAIVDITKPEEITFEQQKILAEVNKYFSKNIKDVLQNYNRSIPSRGECALVIEGLSEMQRFVQEPSNQQKNIIRETEAQIDENSDEEFKDANKSIFPKKSKTLLVPERLHSETSVIATDQKIGIQNNNRQPSPRIEKKTIIAASTLAIAGVALGVAIAVYLEMLAVGIVVGACCLVAAVIIYCCNSPSGSLENSDATIVTNKRHLEA